jgi:hypothetical protein
MAASEGSTAGESGGPWRALPRSETETRGASSIFAKAITAIEQDTHE